MKPGKLPPELLARLLEANEIEDERVIIHPAVGRDVAAVRFGDVCLIAKTDPITFATNRIGWYVVHINANDVATVGARPRWFLATALLPERATEERLVESIWQDMQRALDAIDCDLIGGHTEITVGLDRPLLIGQMLAEVACDKLIDKRNIRPGDRVLLTKGVPVEGTAIMAIERTEQLRAAFDEDLLARARAFLDEPGISVVSEALAAVAAGEVHGMHDPTEGGLSTGLWELAQAADCGMLIHSQSIPLLEPGAAFCRYLGLDPLGTISSGALIICTPENSAQVVAQAVRELGIECADIGEVRPREEGCTLLRDGRPVEMPVFPQDEITRLF